MAIGWVKVRKDGRTEDASEEFALFAGYTRREILGKPLDELLPPKVRAPHVTWMKEWFEAGRPPRIMGRHGSDVHLLHSSGDLIPAYVGLQPSMDEDCAIATVVPRLPTSHEKVPWFKRREFALPAMLVFFGIVIFMVGGDSEELKMLGASLWGAGVAPIVGSLGARSDSSS